MATETNSSFVVILRRTDRRRFRRGLSLVDVMSAIVALAIMVIGAANYRYYAAMDERKASMQITAARIGVLFCESWRGVKGTDTYDPTIYSCPELSIAASTGPEKPEDFTLLGSYTVELSGGNYHATLSWKDVHAELRALNVVVAWTLQGQGEAGDEYELFKLTTYALN